MERRKAMTETSGVLAHEGVDLAWRRVVGAGPTVLCLPGFNSAMAGRRGETRPSKT